MAESSSSSSPLLNTPPAVCSGVERAGVRIEFSRAGGARIQDDFPPNVLQHGTLASRCEFHFKMQGGIFVPADGRMA